MIERMRNLIKNAANTALKVLEASKTVAATTKQVSDVFREVSVQFKMYLQDHRCRPATLKRALAGWAIWH